MDKEVNPVERSCNLVLGRRQGQRVHVGDNVILEIAQIRGDNVKLRFLAPESVRIVRSELLKAA